MDLQLTNKKVLVTGFTAAIGFAIASLLTQEGAAVVVDGRSQGRVEEAPGGCVDRVGPRLGRAA
jgi:NADP-dependent 3-hydroxy acid dehydrogenase YdfG